VSLIQEIQLWEGKVGQGRDFYYGNQTMKRRTFLKVLTALPFGTAAAKSLINQKAKKNLKRTKPPWSIF
jgi:hypothetical protein